MYTIKFRTLEEYVTEVIICKEQIAEKTLRATFRYTQVSNMPINRVQLICTCLVGRAVLRLEESMGEIWGLANADDQKTRDRQQQSFDRLESVAKGLGLSLRAGVIEIPEVGK